MKILMLAVACLVAVQTLGMQVSFEGKPLAVHPARVSAFPINQVIHLDFLQNNSQSIQEIIRMDLLNKILKHLKLS